MQNSGKMDTFSSNVKLCERSATSLQGRRLEMIPYQFNNLNHCQSEQVLQVETYWLTMAIEENSVNMYSQIFR